MAQEFMYPNLAAGTDEWSEWNTPAIGATDYGKRILSMTFPRELALGDVVHSSVEVEFKKLDLTAQKSRFRFQGAVDGSWHPDNPVCNSINVGLNKLINSTRLLDGVHIFYGSFSVHDRYIAGGWNTTPAGHKVFSLGYRIDLCRAGSFRVRRLMVTLNGDGVPHAWAPGEGEVWP